MTDSEIIDELGGTAEVARLCKVSPSAVTQWRENGIPTARRMYLELARPSVFRRQRKDDSPQALAAKP